MVKDMKAVSRVNNKRHSLNKSQIEKSASISNSLIGKSVMIYRFAVIDESSIDNNCIVGDFSRLTRSHLGSFVKIDRYNLIYYAILGNFSYTGHFSLIMHSEIGKYCSISHGVTIGPGEHDYNRISSHDFLYNDFYKIKPTRSKLPYDRFREKSKIGNDVWIGANSTILRGVVIGDGAVIGANSVVTKDIPPYAIFFGNPARLYKYRFSKKIIDQLIELEWWNLPIETIKRKYSAFINKDVEDGLNELLKK